MSNLITFLKSYNPFATVDADTTARNELDAARVGLLEAQRQRDYYAKMAEFYEVRITALTKGSKKCSPARTTSSEPSTPALT